MISVFNDSRVHEFHAIVENSKFQKVDKKIEYLLNYKFKFGKTLKLNR